ncbi:MAG: XdhC/CoxI family protein [Clostridia bacterium]
MKIFDEIIRLRNAGKTCVLVTVVEKSGDGPVEVGKKMLVAAEGFATGTVGGGALERYARERCRDILESHDSIMEKYILNEGEIIKGAETLPMVCGGAVSLFYEYIGPRAHVYIFGAGHVGQATVNILRTMNYSITVIDERKDVYAAFEGADRKFNMPFAEFIDQEGIRDGSFVLVCTPSHENDYNVIYKVIELGLKPVYIGMLCSPAKLRDFLTRLRDRFGDNMDLANLYSPVGLDTGGGSPAEIAVSIAAEILAVDYKKAGHRHMRSTEYKW